MTNDVRQMVGGKFVRSFGARNDTHQSIASARPLRAIAFRRPKSYVYSRKLGTSVGRASLER